MTELSGGLVADHVSRAFGDDQAVQDVTLRVMPGQIHALVGLNGAGKTTLLRMLLGMLRPDQGRVLIKGRNIAKAAPSSLWRHVGHLVDSAFCYPELTVTENLRAVARLRGLSAAEADLVVNRGIADLRLSHWADRRTRALSAGNRQRLGLAGALLGSPDVVILDEPTGNLDPGGVVLVRRLLSIAATRQAAVLLSSHHLDEMARVADAITVLHRGRIIGILDPHGVDLERRFFDMVLAEDEAEPGSEAA
jgi:ABC-2 type transport system ATP-binding protein